MKIDFNLELLPLIKYYEALIKGQDRIGVDMEEITKDIIKKKESENSFDIEDFINLEINSFNVNLYTQEMVKVASSIKTLYRICVNSKFVIDIPDKYKNILDSVIKDNGFDFSMYVDHDVLKFKNDDFPDRIRQMCERMVDPSSLEDRYSMLKDQYEYFLKIKDQDGSKKTD